MVATLRIAEHIADGTTDVDKLAAAAGCDQDVLHRVLGHLVSRGVFAEPAPGQFALNEAARGLLDPALVLGLDLDGFGGRMAHAWGSLLTAARTGRPAYDTVFGRPFWADLDAHPDIAASFDALMGPAGHGEPDPEVLLDGDWDAVRTVVDVGGGTGTLLAGVLRARPATTGILIDLPRTVARAAGTFDSAGVAGRATTPGGSFFDPLPAGADLYLLKSVLADWPDAEAAAILRRCAEAVSRTGRVVVLGGVTPGAAAGESDLLMMVLLGGRQRTLAEFAELAARAGLAVTASGRQPSGRYVVECRPAPTG
ncbi:hydroxyneurosporene methyltransferase [Solihabitans fulvus]|uniref:Hydroxyneurosporene methyltransferase n=1 Tax=Solihabitans fulvus TaxID=1892852 RepID=A0A5B2XR02_9PSEU|nr:hydroxyneurosporene methyltransferase [Solihabitans fulvus]